MSKELESFDRIKNYQVIVDAEKDEVKTISELLPSSCNEVETALKKQEQDQIKLKALEVILKRDFVDLKLLRRCRSHYEYNRQVAIRYESRGMDIALLQEDDFEILKKAML